MKRFALIALAACLAVFISACGEPKKETKGNEPTPMQQPNKAAEPAAPAPVAPAGQPAP